MNLDELRREFPVTEKYVYFDHASVGPMPRRSLRAVLELNEQKLMGKLHWDEWEDVLEEAREVIAEFISAKRDEIALTANTTEGLGIVTNGINWGKDDNIVTTDLEFPSSLFACQGVSRRHGAELRVVRNVEGALPLTEYAKAIDEHTKLVVFSHVQFSNGYRTELKELAEIAHARGAMVLVDAIQSLGSMPLDVRREGVDFLSSGGYKWLLSPIGVGFLYVKKERLEDIAPSILGYRSDEEVYDLYYRELSLAESARRFEHGQRNFPGFAGMKESLKLLLQVGLRQVQKRVWGLGDRIVEGAREVGLGTNSSTKAENRSGIVNLKFENPEKAEELLLKEGIVVSARKGIRVSPHYYNTKGEVERFLTTLEALK